MLCNKEEEGMEAGSKVDKFKMFKEQQGVYVGESARSIFERAKEHHHDALEKSEESHMVKHWTISHPELEEPRSSTSRWWPPSGTPSADSSVRPSGLT